MYAINKLREEVASYDFLSEKHRGRLYDLIDAVEMQFYDDLVSVQTAAKMLGVTERQVHNIADNHAIDLWKYNPNGTPKLDTRPTKTCYRVSEILKYKEESK